MPPKKKYKPLALYTPQQLRDRRSFTAERAIRRNIIRAIQAAMQRGSRRRGWYRQRSNDRDSLATILRFLGM